MSKTIDSAGVTSAAPTQLEEPLRQVLVAWNDAAATWDVEGLASLYAPDTLMFGGRPYHSIGRQGMRDYFGSYSASLKSAKLDLVEQVLVELAPVAVLAQGFGLFEFVLTDGRRTNARMRTTLVIGLRDGAWTILQHHFSNVPDKPPTDA